VPALLFSIQSGKSTRKEILSFGKYIYQRNADVRAAVVVLANCSRRIGGPSTAIKRLGPCVAHKYLLRDTLLQSYRCILERSRVSASGSWSAPFLPTGFTTITKGLLFSYKDHNPQSTVSTSRPARSTVHLRRIGVVKTPLFPGHGQSVELPLLGDVRQLHKSRSSHFARTSRYGNTEPEAGVRVGSIIDWTLPNLVQGARWANTGKRVQDAFLASVMPCCGVASVGSLEMVHFSARQSYLHRTFELPEIL
jgi:hypothetical protein